jgi:hypothetical protein
VDDDAVHLDLLVGRRDPHQLAGVDAAARDEADDEVALGDLERNLVRSRRRDAEDLRRLLQPLAVEADAGERRVVRDEVLGDELVDDAPVAAVVVVDGLDVAADQRLVLFGGHAAALPGSSPS